MSTNDPTPIDPAVTDAAAGAAPELGTVDDAPGSAPVDDVADDDTDTPVGFGGFIPTTSATDAGGPGVAARIGAEALGTFALVIVTLGTVLYSPLSGAGAFGSALAAGLVLAAATATLGHVSGGHFNPAVTLGSAIAGRTPWLDLPLYWLAQLVGGVAAAAVLFSTIPSGLPGLLQLTDAGELWAMTANGWDSGSPLWAMSGDTVGFDLKAALLLETVAAALLVAVVLGARHRRALPGAAPIAIGFTYAALLLVLSPVTGASLNPARSTASAIFAGGDAIGQVWLFWAAPLLGAAIAGLAWFAFAGTSVEDEAIDAIDAQDDGEPVPDRY
ncbi:aquaporin [Cellulomonas sp. KRMCY2]|uniref:aquaporin n=1 Tax=Cellulomonas sp. KRMCY2 TaxID=1304865 RepID=UPI00045E94B5|nr:aquaporin [Cellulomonas sp. KRMCY2]